MAGNHRLDGKLVTLFGGGGFVGRATAQALMQAGARVRIVGRNTQRAYAIKALGNLGQVQFVNADAAREGAATRAAQGSDAIVNFIGILSGDFDRAHRITAQHIAQAASAVGASAMVHVSAIGASETSPAAYGRSKAAGEAAVRAAYPHATILRPSIIFGRGDQFINRFAGLLAMAPVMPVVAPAAQLQPVYVGDVADAITSALADPASHGGKLFELGGPQRLTMRALFEWIAGAIGRHPLLVDVPDGVTAALAAATDWLPGAPITRDQFAMLREGNVAEGPGPAELGITPTPLGVLAGEALSPYRRHGSYTPRSAA